MRIAFALIAFLLSFTAAHAQSAPGKAQPFTIYCNNTSALSAPSINCLWYRLPQTTSWAQTDSPTPSISRIGDRLFIGDAANYTNGFLACGADWWSTFQGTLSPNACGAYSGFSQVVIESGGNGQSGNSTGGITVASQGKNGGATAALLPITAAAVVNNTSVPQFGWGYYGECHVLNSPGSGSSCIGMELDVRDMVGIAGNPDPFQQSRVVGIQNACGAGVTPTGFNCGAAMQILVNPSQWNAGILIFDGSVGIGSAGSINAIAMPVTYHINWFSSAGVVAAGVYAGGAGKLNLDTVNTITTNGNDGVTCGVGINPGTFRSVNGIVTHC